MLRPIRSASYTLDIPLSAKERKENEKARMKGLPVPHQRIRGTFLFRGYGKNSKRVFVFRARPTVEDGVIYAGPSVALTQEDFCLGLDLGKIRGRAVKVRHAS